MASENYKLKLGGLQIVTRRFGLITENNFTDEIAEYLLKSGAYDHIIEKINIKDIAEATLVNDDEIDSEKKNSPQATEKIKTNKRDGFKKSNSKIN